MVFSSDASILVISDIHAQFPVIEDQLTHARDTLGRDIRQILVLGDFGLFAPELHEFFRRDGRRFGAPVAFIEGNHEDFRSFDKLVRNYADVVTYLPRGSVNDFGLGRWLFIGGSRYMNILATPSGSEIKDADIDRCLANPPGSIDIVLSHDCPTGIGVVSASGHDHLGAPGDPGLARLADYLRPRLWFFGHHHRWHESERNGTRFVGLPESWHGYVLLNGAGEMQLVENEVVKPRPPRWWRWLRFR